jgi:centromere/kinetochore protein ZW10
MTRHLANHSIGLGTRHVTERTEKRMIAREQGESIMDTGTAVTQEWDAAWESDGESKEEESESRNRMSLDEERQANEMFSKSISSLTNYDSSCPILLPN